MTAAWLLLALALPASAEPGAAAPRHADLRGTVAVYIVSPPGVASVVPSSAFVDSADRALRAVTNLTARSLEQTGVDASELAACGSELRVSCWARVLRDTSARFLLVVAVQPLSSGTDQLRGLLLDVESARAVLVRALDSDPPGTWRERAEAEIFRLTASSELDPIRTGDSAARDAWFARLVHGVFKDALSRAGCFEPYGFVEVVGGAGMSLMVDARALGPIDASGPVSIALLPGTRQIELRGRGAHREVFTAQVERGQTNTVVASGPPIVRHPARGVVLYGGIATAVAGAAITIYGASLANDGLQGGCLRPAGSNSSCKALGAPSFGYDPSLVPGVDPHAVSPSGVLVAPLGLALAGAGLAWAGGSFLGDAEDAPWWQLAVGAVLGGAVYTALHLTNPR